MKQLGGAADDVGWSYVLASWQVEDQPERYGRYVSAAIAALTQGAEQRATSPDKDARPAAARLRILAAELSRRMGLLPQAEQLLEAARPALDVLPDGDRQWHAAVHARVEARFTGNGYFEDDDVVCANLDGER